MKWYIYKLVEEQISRSDNYPSGSMQKLADADVVISKTGIILKDRQGIFEGRNHAMAMQGMSQTVRPPE